MGELEISLGRKEVSFPALWRLRHAAHKWSIGPGGRARLEGLDDFDYPKSRKILGLIPVKPDVLQIHNLHHGYFDLRALPAITRQIPTVIRMPDEWMYTGHCAYSIECDRWRSGCGSCPDLTRYPAVAKDRTHDNWRLKKSIYKRSRFHVVTPSLWLKQRVEESILKPLSTRVIYNGVDEKLYRNHPKVEARSRLNLPQDAGIVLFFAKGGADNVYKNYRLFDEALQLLFLRDSSRKYIALIAGGEPYDAFNNHRIVRLPYTSDQTVIACYYAAADVFVHTAPADNSPNTVYESLSCGTPVIALAAGGVPEQIKTLDTAFAGFSTAESIGMKSSRFGLDEATGMLIPQADPVKFADAIELVLSNKQITGQLSANARRDVGERFTRQRMIKDYLALHEEILARRSLVNT